MPNLRRGKDILQKSTNWSIQIIYHNIWVKLLQPKMSEIIQMKTKKSQVDHRYGHKNQRVPL